MSDHDTVAGHAFVSYVHEDSGKVDQLQRTLEAAGIPVWRDTDDLWPGEDWRAKIRGAITDDALVFVACFSRKSVAREKSYQNEELVLAIDQLRQRRPNDSWLIPVRFDECDIPDLEIGGARTLASIQRADLFGDGYGEGVARLVAAILRILGRHRDTVTAAVARIEARQIKDLLPFPEQDLRLEDSVTELAARCASAITDITIFPTAADEARTDAIRYVVAQADRYFDTVRPLAEALVVGCAWGSDRHNALWRRTIEGVARAATRRPIGHLSQQVLLELRAFPILLLLYSAGLAAVHRENWTALYAVTSEAQTRDDIGRRTSLIGFTNVWMPFASIQISAQVLAFEVNGTALSDADIEALRTGAKAGRHTPVSDYLHDRIRPLLSPIIRDDADYDDVFDELEILLGVIAADAAVQADRHGQYLHGPSIGAFSWRRRFETPLFEQQVWIRRRGSLLSAGFFSCDDRRAEEAFDKFAADAQAVRQRQF